MTDDVAAQNLAHTVRAVRERLGFGVTDDIPFALEDDYRRALAAAILQSPSLYSAQTIANARRYVEEPEAAALADNGPLSQLYTFGDALTEEALKIGGAAAAIGQGAINAANLLRLVLPLTLLALVAGWVWRVIRR